jgi:hypothetical protein
MFPTPDERSRARRLAGGVVDVGRCTERRADMAATGLGPSTFVHCDEERIVEPLENNSHAHGS